MILSKSKIYESKLINHDLLDEDFIEDYLEPIENKRWDRGIIRSVYENHEKLVRFFMYKGAKWKYYGMSSAVEKGREKLVDFFISKGVDNWNTGMYDAAQGGQEKLVHFFISKGANAWNSAMVEAADGGYVKLVDFFINQGADDWNRALSYAHLRKNKNVIKYLEEYLGL